MDKLLGRQLRKAIGSASRPTTDAQWEAFLASVQQAYEQASEDRRLLERSLELASGEMLARNAALGREASLLSATLEATGDAIAVMDANGNLTTFNQNYLDMWGYTREFVLRATPTERLTKVASLFPDPPSAIARIREILASEGTTSDLLRLLDGRVIACETRLQRLGDQIVGRVWSFRDITATHHAEEALRRSEARSRALIANISDVITVTDEQGRYKFVSASVARILGYSPEEFIGKTVSDFIHPDDAARVRSTFARLCVEGGSVRTEFRYRHRDGSWRTLESLRVDARQTPGVEGFLGVARDVTDQRQLEADALAHRDAAWRNERLTALGTLVAGVAHEINNPLTYIVGNLELIELLLDDLPADTPNVADLRRQIKTALGGAARIERITKSLKTVAKQTVDERRMVDLGEVVRNVADLLYSGSSSQVEIAVSNATEAAHVMGDAGQLHQVVLNLAKNAIEAIGPAPGRVTLELARVEEGAEVRVRDTGPGIPPETQARLFTPFFTTKTEGTGLGLAIVHTIVKAHAGEILVDSRPGSGTTFVVRIPLALAGSPESFK